VASAFCLPSPNHQPCPPPWRWDRKESTLGPDPAQRPRSFSHYLEGVPVLLASGSCKYHYIQHQDLTPSLPKAWLLSWPAVWAMLQLLHSHDTQVTNAHHGFKISGISLR
jgi:hypothetical protein